MHGPDLIVLLSETPNAYLSHGVTRSRKFPSPLRTNHCICSVPVPKPRLDRVTRSGFKLEASGIRPLIFPTHCLPFDRHRIFNRNTEQALQIIELIRPHHLLWGLSAWSIPNSLRPDIRKPAKLMSRPVRPPSEFTSQQQSKGVPLDQGSHKAPSDRVSIGSFCRLSPWEMGRARWRR